MVLDTLTLFTCVTAANIAGSVVLFIVALAMHSQPRECRRGCLVWSLALLLSGVSCVLTGMRGQVSDTLSIVIANALLLLGTGLQPTAISQFFGKRSVFLYIPPLAVAIWLALCAYPPFRDDFVARVVYIQSLMIVASLFGIWALIKFDDKKLVSSRMLACVLSIEVISFSFFASSQVLALHDSFLEAFQTTTMSVYLVAILASMVLTTTLVVAMTIESTQKKFQQDARVDVITGIANRREFEDAIRTTLDQSAYPPRQYALAIIEIDHLDHLRENYGEAMGDALLKLLSRICRDSLPAKGIIARIGDKQFGMFLPDRTETFACALARGLARTYTTASRQASGGNMVITLSTGVFSGGRETSSSRALEIADRCLLRAKQQGRNRVVVNEDNQSTPLKSVTVEAPFSTHHRPAA